MCGIFCVAAPVVERETVASATRKLAHRGPDDFGIFIGAERNIGLGHCRLSIIDLSEAGHQPMSDGEEDIWLTYNGEIYNFIEIRTELKRYGCRFRSCSDTEVIIHAYKQWGIECLGRLRGMFAFAIWDVRRKSLLLARDRIGIKPLYYYSDDRMFIAASELKAITAYPGVVLNIDKTALYDFLTYRYVPTPKTPYATVRKVAPGHYLTFQDGRIQTHCYWDVDFGRVAIKSEAEAVEGLKAELEEAVRLHLVADVPVGLWLSGGVDSSAILSVAAGLSKAPISTFSIGFDVEQYDERKDARAVASALKSIHTEDVVDRQRGRQILECLAGLYDEPFGDTSSIPTFAVSELARRTSKVSLSGDGGDELFGGYAWYSYLAWYENLERIPVFARRAGLAALAQIPGEFRGKTFISAARGGPLEFYATILGGLSRAEKMAIIKNSVFSEIDVPKDYDDYWYFRQYWREELNGISRVQYLDLKTYLADDILTKVDRASMAVGLEVRPVLLDHRFVEFVAAIHPSIRNKQKYLLKLALGDMLPTEVMVKIKKGFSAPVGSWIDESEYFRSLGHIPLNAIKTVKELRPSKRFLLMTLRDWLARYT